MKKNTLLVIIITAVIAVLSILTYTVFFKEDKNNTLTIAEKRWIESNKNNVIDLGILNDVVLLNYNGEGLFLDFIKDLEENTNLSFNKVSYSKDNKNEYSLIRKKEFSEKDILIYQDNYVLISKERGKFTSLNKLDGLVIGVKETDLEQANSFLRADVTFKSFDTDEKMFEEISLEDSNLDAIVVSKLDFVKKIDPEKPLYIIYDITEMTDNYVLTLGKEEKLNTIFNKYYSKWQEEKYADSKNLHLTNNYFSIMNIDEQSQVKFRSKRYAYGYIDNLPYDTEIDEEMYGINNAIISSFADFANIEIIYQNYANSKALKEAFKKNELDFYFDNYDYTEYDMDTYQTVSPFEETIVIISKLSNKITINSIRSLQNKEVLTISGSAIEEYLADNKITVKSYKTVSDLIKKSSDDSILALNLANYNYYVRKELSKFKVDYQIDLTKDYNYLIRNIKNNEIFVDYFDFYLTFVNTKELINEGYNTLLNVSNSNQLNKIVYSFLTIIIGLLAIIFVYKKLPVGKKKTLTKEDKLRYVDMLTSLKNRNYLNDNIEKWDESEIYPQAIVIIDLNNIAYINDNYGHTEGDNVIKEAANVLITNQIPSSDIIRTNGNEFLIYLIGYDEKQIVSYIRKLSKEFKNLSHGFGSAIGYSIITDAIKTIDDAVNEATLDMRNNKEDLNN